MGRATATWTDTEANDFAGNVYPDELAFLENILQNIENLRQKNRIFKTYVFRFDNLAGTATQDMVLDAASGTLGASPTTVKAPAAGSFVGLALVSNAARTNGTASARFTIANATSGTDIGCQLNGTDTLMDDAIQQTDVDRFAAGNLLGMEITTSGWTPTTADITGYLTVAYDAE